MRQRFTVSLAASAALMLLVLLLPAAARADVLVNAPSPHITLGQSIESGVWYQSYSGGPRWAKIAILTSTKRVVWSRQVTASASGWHYYHYRPSKTGTYTLRYTTANGTSSFKVRVTR